MEETPGGDSWMKLAPEGEPFAIITYDREPDVEYMGTIEWVGGEPHVTLIGPRSEWLAQRN